MAKKSCDVFWHKGKLFKMLAQHHDGIFGYYIKDDSWAVVKNTELTYAGKMKNNLVYLLTDIK